jgi:hypothetical protein
MVRLEEGAARRLLGDKRADRAASVSKFLSARPK